MMAGNNISKAKLKFQINPEVTIQSKYFLKDESLRLK